MATIKDLKFDDKNFNKHTEFGMSLLEKSLRENGAGRSILLDKDNNIIAGNGIVEAAGSVGLEKVKIVEATGDELIAVKRTDISLNSKKGRKMALADNSTAKADLEWDEENLKSEFDEDELKDWGVDLEWTEETEVTEDEAPEVNENEPADSELGKVYKLGNHRLMCGDSTDAGSVAILMDGQKADMVFTDPPYNINFGGTFSYTTKNGKIIGIKDGYAPNNSKYEPIHNDSKSEKDFRLFANRFLDIIKNNCMGGWYICFSSTTLEELLLPLREKEMDWKSIIIFNKNQSPIGGGDYRKKYEPIIYGYFEHNFYGNEYAEDDVWDIKRTLKNDLHPTMKPIPLITKALSNSSKKGGSVLDLFGGSGSTLIACEQLGRKCYMMELDPKYCDVIRKRYWKFTTGSEEGWQDGTKAIL